MKAIACDHEVYVLTSPRHKCAWEEATVKGLVPESVKVRFIGDYSGWHPNRLLARIQSWKEYKEFSDLQLAEAQAWVAEEKMDLAHQITYATWRLPSSLWKLPIPFVWGPIGGVARMPAAFYPTLSVQAAAFEITREISSWVGSRRREFLECMKNSAMIVGANSEALDFLKAFRGRRPMHQMWSGYLSEEQLSQLNPRPLECNPDGILRMFAGGNLEGRKGIALALRALAIAKDRGVKFHYLVAGGGPEVSNLKREADRLKLSSSEVEFHPGLRGDAYVRALHQAEVYLIPSFRETTPVTLLEAMAAGCFPIVSNSSAAGEVVTKYGGEAVAAQSIRGVVEGLADAITRVWKERSSLESRVKDISQGVSHAFSRDLFREKLGQIYEEAYYVGRSE